MKRYTIELKNVRNKSKEKYEKICIDRARDLYNKEEKFLEYIELYKHFTLERR